MTMPWPWPGATDARAICRRSSGFRWASAAQLAMAAAARRFGLVCFAGADSFSTAQGRSGARGGSARAAAGSPGVAPSAPAQLRRGLACACWRTCVHARVCVRLCASACCPVLTASLHPSAACRPSGAWMAPTDYLTTFAPATVSGVLETASAYSIDRANLLVGACFPIILPPLPAPPRPAPPRPASPLLCQTPLRRR